MKMLTGQAQTFTFDVKFSESEDVVCGSLVVLHNDTCSVIVDVAVNETYLVDLHGSGAAMLDYYGVTRAVEGDVLEIEISTSVSDCR